MRLMPAVKRYAVLQRGTQTKNARKIWKNVAKEPMKAGIDPYNKLIDRNPKDNVVDVKVP